tara:strand:- start:97 stop:699 length:603 start_codon:yes stop_codon:yes gene_type:complete
MNYYVIKKMGRGDYKNRGSKFYSFSHNITSITDYKHLVSIYKSNFPEACHVCSAYRLFVGSRLDEHASDDGEPKGSSGQPILNQLRSNNLVNTAIYVVRVFGGTLLGIPGLIDSYSNAALLAIDNSQYVIWHKKKRMSLKFSYKYQGLVESIIKEFSATIEEENFSKDISITISIEEDYLNLFKDKIKELSSGRIIPIFH